MRKIVILLLFSFISCKKSFVKDDFLKLNGYWQIEKVTFPDGSERSYNDAPSVDYIEINDSLVGFRIKLVPTLNGKFESNDVKEYFYIKDDSFYYKTDFSEWTEKIVSIEDSVFSVKNEEGKQYTYIKKNIK